MARVTFFNNYFFCYYKLLQMYITEISFGTPEYDEEVGLRDRILRQPLGLQFHIKDLEKEYNDIHLVCFAESGKMAGCLILSPVDQHVIKMRQVAVDLEWQKKGVGTMLVAASEKFASQHGYDKIVLHARDLAVPFYLRLGYEVYGEPFTEVGIEHRAMRKKIT